MFFDASVFALRAVLILFGFVGLCLGFKDLKESETPLSAGGNESAVAGDGNSAATGIQRFLNPKYNLLARHSAQYSRLKETDVRSSKRQSQPTPGDPTVQCGDRIMRVVVKLQDVDNLQVVAGE